MLQHDSSFTPLHWDHSGEFERGEQLPHIVPDHFHLSPKGTSSSLMLHDAFVFLSGPASSFGEHVKTVMVFKDSTVWDVLENEYPTLFHRYRDPSTSDTSGANFLHDGVYRKLLRDRQVAFVEVKLHVGDFYIIPAGRPHFFYTHPDVPHSSVGWTARVDTTNGGSALACAASRVSTSRVSCSLVP